MWENKDIKKVLVSEEQIKARSAELGRQITEDYKDCEEPLLLVALLRGSVPFLAELMKHIDLDIQVDFMDVSSYQGTKSTDIRIIKDLDTSIQGMNILLVDEGTSALDPKTEAKVMDCLYDQGMTLVMIAHRLETVARCDQIYVIEQGRVTQHGTHDELRQMDGLYSNLLKYA